MRVWLTLLICLFGPPAWANEAKSAGHIYLLKGLANVFSTGLDTLNSQLSRRGYNSSVHSYLDYKALAETAARRERSGQGPVVIVGHSLGADNAVLMADEMNRRKARVALLVLFGPDYAMSIPPNVSRVINYHGSGAAASGAKGFAGKITNISFDNVAGVNHFNVEKIERYHLNVISNIQPIFRRPKEGPASQPDVLANPKVN